MNWGDLELELQALRERLSRAEARHTQTERAQRDITIFILILIAFHDVIAITILSK